MSPPGFVGYPPPAEDAESWLRREVHRLAALGRSPIIGPLPDSTWNPHRLVTWSDGSPPFLLESPRMFQDPAPWLAAGFRPIDAYCSTRVPLIPDPRLEASRARLSGIRIRPIRLSHYEEDLRALHTLSLKAFQRNAWYTPIAEANFMDLYLPFRERLDPGYILLAENGDGVCGFVFSAVDPRRGELIVKTLAVLPGRAFAGLGALLVEVVQTRARAQGMTHAIHALMHDKNASRNTAREATVLRRYHLFASAPDSEWTRITPRPTGWLRAGN